MRMKDADRAYHLRRIGRLKWREIAEKTQYSSKEGANMAAAAFAKRHNLEWPLPLPLSNGELAYCFARESKEWDDIAEMLHIPSVKRCRNAARHYASRHKLPWPPAWIKE